MGNERITSLGMRGGGGSAARQVESFLAANEGRLRPMSPDAVLAEVRRNVPAAGPSRLSDFELRTVIAAWRAVVNSPQAPRPIPPARPRGDTELVAAVKKAVAVAVDGVDIKYGAGRLNIGVGGSTLELAKGRARAAAQVGWTGALSAETQVGDFKFSGSLSAERWEVRLSYPEDTVVPDLSKLGKVFGEGADAMWEILTATASFRGLNDAARVKEAVTPHLDGVKASVTAVQRIAKAPRVSLGVSFGSPEPGPSGAGARGGLQGQVVFTVRF